MIDKRLNWEYDGCKIIPINCQHPTWGQTAQPIAFGDGKLRSLYWRIDFPDKSWVHSATKAECRRYIDSCKERRPDRWVKPMRKMDNKENRLC